MPAALTAAAPNRRTQRERRANSRYEDDVDPEDEAALLNGDAPQVGCKRKDPPPPGAAGTANDVFGPALSIPRRARSLRSARDGDSDQSAAGGSNGSAAHAAAAALQFGRRPAAKRQPAAPEDQAVAELLLGMGDMITARTESLPSSSDGDDGSGNGGGGARRQQQRPARRRRKSAKAREQSDSDDGAALPRHSRRLELPPPPPGKRRAAVAAVSAITAAAASDKAPSDDDMHLGIDDMDAAPPAARKLARPPPRGTPRSLPAAAPLAADLANGDAKERSRLAGPVAPADGFDETLRHVHQAQRHVHHIVRKSSRGTMTDAAAAAAAGGHPADAAQDQKHAVEVKRPFWEAPDHAASGAGGVDGGGGGAAAGGQQRGPVRLLRITVPPVEGRCKCGRRISAAHPACKSELMMLCDRFIRKFGRLGPGGAPSEIMLNNVAAQLGVPRRRLYDIINVMEAVEVVSRTSKLTYMWKGMAHLPSLLQRLVKEEDQGMAMECRLRKCGTPTARPSSATSVSAAAVGTPFSNGAAQGASDGSAHGGGQNGSVHGGAAGAAAAANAAALPNSGVAPAPAANGPTPAANGPAPAANGINGGERTSHSLWLYTRKFVRLLLTKAQGPISLAEAAHQLMGDVPEAKRAQTQVTVERRLYDIGSILSSANLIKKSYLGRKRQPAFSWVWEYDADGNPLPPELQPQAAAAFCRSLDPGQPDDAGSPQQQSRALQPQTPAPAAPPLAAMQSASGPVAIGQAFPQHPPQQHMVQPVGSGQLPPVPLQAPLQHAGSFPLSQQLLPPLPPAMLRALSNPAALQAALAAMPQACGPPSVPQVGGPLPIISVGNGQPHSVASLPSMSSLSSTGSLPVPFQAMGSSDVPMSPVAMQQMASMLWSAHSAAQMEAVYRANASVVGGAVPPPQPQVTTPPPPPPQQPQQQQQQQQQGAPSSAAPSAVPTPADLPLQPLPRQGSPAAPPAEGPPSGSASLVPLPAALLPPVADAAVGLPDQAKEPAAAQPAPQQSPAAAVSEHTAAALPAQPQHHAQVAQQADAPEILSSAAADAGAAAPEPVVGPVAGVMPSPCAGSSSHVAQGGLPNTGRSSDQDSGQEQTAVAAELQLAVHPVVAA